MPHVYTSFSWEHTAHIRVLSLFHLHFMFGRDNPFYLICLVFSFLINLPCVICLFVCFFHSSAGYLLAKFMFLIIVNIIGGFVRQIIDSLFIYCSVLFQISIFFFSFFFPLFVCTFSIVSILFSIIDQDRKGRENERRIQEAWYTCCNWKTRREKKIKIKRWLERQGQSNLVHGDHYAYAFMQLTLNLNEDEMPIKFNWMSAWSYYSSFRFEIEKN